MIRFTALVSMLALAVASFSQSTLIVQLQPGHAPVELEALFPVQVEDVTPGAPFVLYRVTNGTDPHVIEDQMRQRPDLVVLAEDNTKMEAPENIGAGKGGTIAAVWDTGTIYRENEGLFQQISLRPMMRGYTGRLVKVAILDTGVPVMNLTIRSRVLGGVAVAPDRNDYFDAPSGANTNGNQTPDDALGHGSMVTGLFTQISPNARYLIARVADSDGVSQAWYIIKGLAYACQNGAEVVNISLGSVSGIVALNDIIENWVLPQGVLVCSAAGNNADSRLTSPADISSCIAVAGVDANDKKAVFSNWHSKVDQSAPATGVKSAWWDNTIGVWSGTSFASPMVAATIADALQFRSRFQPSQMKVLLDRIEVTGDDIDAKNPDYRGDLGRRLNCQKLRMMILRF